MQEAILRACETFSKGDVESILDHISEGVTWEVVGEKKLKGLSDLRAFCSEMTQEGMPQFQIRQTTVGDGQIAVEGSETKPDGISFCDCYTIVDGKIQEIRSYCIGPK